MKEQNDRSLSSVLDGRERDTHASADGQVVALNATFDIGGDSAIYPSDDSALAEDRFKCHCVVLASNLPGDRRREVGNPSSILPKRWKRDFCDIIGQEFDGSADESLPLPELASY